MEHGTVFFLAIVFLDGIRIIIFNEQEEKLELKKLIIYVLITSILLINFPDISYAQEYESGEDERYEELTETGSVEPIEKQSSDIKSPSKAEFYKALLMNEIAFFTGAGVTFLALASNFMFYVFMSVMSGDDVMENAIIKDKGCLRMASVGGLAAVLIYNLLKLVTNDSHVEKEEVK